MSSYANAAVWVTPPDPRRCIVAHRRVMKPQPGTNGAAFNVVQVGDFVERERAKRLGLIDGEGALLGDEGTDLWLPPEPAPAA